MEGGGRWKVEGEKMKKDLNGNGDVDKDTTQENTTACV
jgi:hypothetical protein